MRIEFGPRSEDPYGRALFYVYTETAEREADKLIREGLGKAWEKGTGSTGNCLWVLKMVRRGMATEGYRWYSVFTLVYPESGGGGD